MLKKPMASKQSIHESKTKLLDAALLVIRDKGYSATRIEDICKTAGLTKGSFFHHFESKEALALAAANYWIEGTSRPARTPAGLCGLPQSSSGG